ncbi:MAG TPA: ShlB/FhaC/HecB family hemolysin secretion/activation protein [Ramlibacter sp.]|uniref:ShlB/FhaC/HecB family hemolysin secretion/activation protein n=1 Tax=Ramlibacter sp. TaxID=1917967 RepID=UPI002C23A81A|nr:ShlB/FhaC/HecB family hemolysin secretion/activation protein [Ramlibacter sp.]HVZ42433.1 ShlB/FhaC/HecB family hemolysin secretion/activation protein [Ramlibacter sp.]
MEKNLTAPGQGGARRHGPMVVPRSAPVNAVVNALLNAAVNVVAGAAVAAAVPCAALAQARAANPAAPAPMATPAPSPHFTIRGFKVTGDNPLGEGETARVLAPFLRADATIDTLQQATAALEAELRRRGYGLHRVALPPQEVGDTVTLNIVTFTIDKVVIEGRKIYDEGNIRRTVPELQEGRTPNFRKLAIQTAIANENPNKQIQVGIREADEPDKINAAITVKEEKPWTFGLGASNGGTKASGEDRVTLTAGHTNLWDLDHQIVAAYTTSLERTSDVKQFGLAYKIPLYQLGGVIGASYTKSDVVGNFGAFTSTGAGHTFGLSYTHYFEPDGGRRSYLTVGLDDKVFKGTVINGIPIGIDRRSAPLTLGYTARTETDTYVFGYDIALSANTGVGSHNDLFSYQSEYAGIDTTSFKVLRGAVSYVAPFATSWAWNLRGTYQFSPDPLISGEQFGLGGLGSVRGTTIDRPISGDSGAAVTFEVTTPEFTEGLRALGFVDAGWISNNRSDGVQRLSSDHLASAGVGLRYAKGQFAATADYGRIIEGSRMPLTTNSAAPKRGDDRFYVNLSVKF